MKEPYDIISNQVDKFFSKWIRTTPLKYKANILSSSIRKMRLCEKFDVINRSLIWSREKCGYNACITLHATWMSMLLIKLSQYKSVDKVCDAFEIISDSVHSTEWADWGDIDPCILRKIESLTDFALIVRT